MSIKRIDKLKDNYKKSKIDPVVEFEKLTQGSNSYKPKPIIDTPLSDFEYEKSLSSNQSRTWRRNQN